MATRFIRPKACVKSELSNGNIELIVCRKIKKSKRRSLRRKRSRLNYWNRRREQRLNRKSKDLCDTISVISINDMDYEIDYYNQSYLEPLPEVAEWHKHQQIVYWKSRALALEYENQMLHKHIQTIYEHQIQDYVDYKNDEEISPPVRRDKRKQENTSKKIWKAPEANSKRVKSEAMKKLYGDMAPKISGMETAIQLNYDLYLEKHNPQLWPNIPLRLYTSKPVVITLPKNPRLILQINLLATILLGTKIPKMVPKPWTRINFRDIMHLENYRPSLC
ncbi:hypothetical protein FQR65_LT02424 [Abscondita terminalis]|nr:hypothetical protein FQR65_LT02424 [Abscondita terminalis]